MRLAHADTLPKIRLSTIGAIVIVVVVLFVQPSFTQKNPTKQERQEQVIPQVQLASFLPVWQTDYLHLEDTSNGVTLSAKSAIALDVDTGAELFTYNADQVLAPASVTKLMTALVARDLYFLDQVFEVREEAFTLGHVVDLRPGEELSVRSLLKAVLIQSGNDAAYVLANNHPEGYTAFIAAMNRQAGQLGLEKSIFKNASGLDEVEHQMTAREVSLVLAEVIKDPFLRSLISQTRSDIVDVSGLSPRVLYNTHQLLAEPYVMGGKTGTTPQAGQVLTSLVDVQGHEVIITIMGSQDRYQDTQALYGWLETHVNWVPVEQTSLVH